MSRHGAGRLWRVHASRGALEPERLAMAKRMMDRHQYNSAVELLKTYIADNPGSGDVDEAIDLLGESYLAIKSWVEAQNEFERLLRDYPESDSSASRVVPSRRGAVRRGSAARFRPGVQLQGARPVAALSAELSGPLAQSRSGEANRRDPAPARQEASRHRRSLHEAPSHRARARLLREGPERVRRHRAPAARR